MNHKRSAKSIVLDAKEISSEHRVEVRRIKTEGSRDPWITRGQKCDRAGNVVLLDEKKPRLHNGPQ